MSSSAASSEAIRRVAIVGTGVIGSGWAALFAAKGFTVVAYVRSKSSQEKFIKFLQRAWSNLMARGIATDADGWQAVACVFNLAECVADADYVQESVIEDLPLKQLVIKEIDEFAPPHVIIGSSSSFIPLSLVRLRAKHPERIATAHPSLPHWDAFCEVLGATPEITRSLGELYEKRLGMDVVLMKNEMHGHALNALLGNLIGTSTSLVNGGVCDAQSLDTALEHLCRVITASGGLSGTAIGMIGGGSRDAYLDLNADILSGYPVGKAAVWISRYVPTKMAAPALSLLQGACGVFAWPCCKRVFRRIAKWSSRDVLATWDSGREDGAFEAEAIARVRALEDMAASERAAH